MKKKIISILLTCTLFFGFSENFSFYGLYEDMVTGYINFMPNHEGMFAFYEGKLQNFEYSINQDSKVPIISFKNPIITYVGKIVSKILILNSYEIDFDGENNKIRRLAFLYDNESEPENLLISDTKRNFGIYYSYSNQTSYLIEGKKEYSVNNLSSIELETPWVEGVKGYGIGEGFRVDFRLKNDNYLLVMNGYISFEKPYLYEQNGRIKKIKVTGLESQKSAILEVWDTPHPQTVDISFLDKSEGFAVEIVDIYPGTKYEDTCIQYLAPYENQVIPYE